MSSASLSRFAQGPLTGSKLTASVLFIFVLLLVSASLLSCGSNKSSVTSPPIPGIAGAWEFVAASNDNNLVTGIEVALKEGQVLVNGFPQPNGQLSANSTQIAYVSLTGASQPYSASGFGGPCAAAASANNSLGPGTVTAPNASMNFTFTANGIVFNATGTLSGDGQSFSGTYAQSGTTCADSGGTINGNIVPKVAGTFGGKMCTPTNNPNNVSCSSSSLDTVNPASASESSSGTLTLSLTFTAGPDAGANLTLQGPVVGNAFTVTGTFGGNLVTYYGYYEVASNSPTLYMLNSADPCFSDTSTKCTSIKLGPAPQ